MYRFENISGDTKMEDVMVCLDYRSCVSYSG
jgi:hypothetical protein